MAQWNYEGIEMQSNEYDEPYKERTIDQEIQELIRLESNLCKRERYTQGTIFRSIVSAYEEQDMPLKKSTSKKVFEENVKAEVKAGKPVKQAVAIAYDVKRKSKK